LNLSIAIFCLIVTVAWTLGLRELARYAGWRSAHAAYPGSIFSRGDRYLFVTIWFGTNRLAGMPGTLVVTGSGLILAPVLPLPFFGALFIPWREVTVIVTRHNLEVRTSIGVTFAVGTWRAVRISQSIKRACSVSRAEAVENHAG
jgi:hypothetical protein